MSLRKLPAHPNLEHLKKQARTLLQERLAADGDAITRFTAFGISADEPKLADALHVIAVSTVLTHGPRPNFTSMQTRRIQSKLSPPR